MRRVISLLLVVSLLSSTVIAPLPGFAQESLLLPSAGSMVSLSSSYVPVLIKGIKVHPQNPLLFDFIIDSGQSGLDVKSAPFKEETQKLIKYFLTSLTIKEDDLWVNLSPYEKDRIIPDALSQTELGRDMLAQDYLLKQITASLIYPENELGKNFWDKIYAQAREKFGTTDVPVNTFNKVWIIADKAKVLERNNAGYVVKAHLKVMLEEDYFALAKGAQESQVTSDPKAGALATGALGTNSQGAVNQLGSQIVREIIIPELEKEVNEGKNFAPLRQMYYAMILAAWYKMAIKDALLNRVYSNQAKTAGILSDDPQIKEKIYQQYLEAFKRGVFNYIKEDVDAQSQEVIPRKYFSGGERIFQIPSKDLIERVSVPQAGDDLKSIGQEAEATVEMNNRPGGVSPPSDPVYNRLQYGLKDIKQPVQDAVEKLLFKARDAFEAQADLSKVRREFESQRVELQKGLPEDLQKSLDVLIPDFDQALVIWLLPYYSDAKLFKDRVARIADISAEAAMLFLGVSGIHARNKLDPTDEGFYSNLVYKAVRFILDDTNALEKRQQAGRALINGLVIYAQDEKYKAFLNSFNSDPRMEGRFTEALKAAFNWNPDLSAPQNGNSAHPIFSWFAAQGPQVWLRYGFYTDARTLRDVATATGKIPFREWPGIDPEVIVNLKTLQEFSGYQSTSPDAIRDKKKNTAVSDLSPGKNDFREFGVFPALTEPRKRELMDDFFHPKDEQTLKNVQKELIQSQDQSLIPVLLDVLERGEKRVQAAEVLGAIGRRGDSRVTNRLVALLKSDNPLLRNAAADGLGKIGDGTTIPALIPALEQDPGHLVSVLVNFNDLQVIDPLIKVAQDVSIDDWKIRRNAIMALRNFNDPRIVEAMSNIWQHEDGSEINVSKAAVAALSNPQTVHELISVLETRRDLAADAVSGLTDIGDPAAIDPVLRLFEAENLKPYARGYTREDKDILYRRGILFFSRLVKKANPEQGLKIKKILNEALNLEATRNPAISGLIMMGDQESLKRIPWKDILNSQTIAKLFENMAGVNSEKSAFDEIFKEAFRNYQDTRHDLLEAIHYGQTPENFHPYMEQLFYWLGLDGKITDRERMENYGIVGLQIADDLWGIGFHREKDRYLDNEELVNVVPEFLSLYLSISGKGQVLNQDQQKIDRSLRLIMKLLIDARLHDADFIHTSPKEDVTARMNRANYYLLGTERSPGLLRKIFSQEGGRELIDSIVNDDQLDEEKILNDLKTISDDTLRRTAALLADNIDGLVKEIRERFKEDGKGKNIWLGYHESIHPILDELKKEIAAVRSTSTISSEKIPNLINRLAGPDKEAAEDAVLDLIGLNAAESVDLLIQLLDNQDSAVRLRSMRALNGIYQENSKMVDAFIARLTDADPDVLRLAAKSLGSLGDRRAVEPLIKKALSGLPEAIDALGKLKDPRAVDALVRVVSFFEPDVSVRAVRALGQIGGSQAAEALTDKLRVLSSTFESLLRNKRVLAITAEVNDSLIPIVRSLRWFKDLKAVEALIPLTKDRLFKDYSPFRKEVIMALTRLIRNSQDIKTKPLIEIFQRALYDDDLSIRQAAAAGIIMTRDKNLITNAVLQQLFKAGTLRILSENIIWDELGVDYLDSVFSGAFEKFPNASDVFEAAMDVYVPSELFFPFVEQILHWLDLNAGNEPQIRMENLRRVGFLVMDHLWKNGLHREDGRFLDNAMLAKIARKFMDEYFDWKKQADLSSGDQRKYNALLRLMINLMTDSRFSKAQYVGVDVNQDDLSRKNITDQFFNGTADFPGLLAGMPVEERQELSKIIQEKQDVNFILSDAATIEGEKYRNAAEAMKNGVNKALVFMEKKIGADIWLGYMDAARPVLDALQKQIAAVAVPTQAAQSSPGGIDLNSKNLDLDVAQEGIAIEVKFDPAMAAEFERGDFSGVFPVILRIIPISGPLPLLGLEEAKDHSLGGL